MIHPFSFAALCCIPSYNPDQRQKEREIMTSPALQQLTASWEATFPEAARLSERQQEQVREFRANPPHA